MVVRCLRQILPNEPAAVTDQYGVHGRHNILQMAPGRPMGPQDLQGPPDAHGMDEGVLTAQTVVWKIRLGKGHTQTTACVGKRQRPGPVSEPLRGTPYRPKGRRCPPTSLPPMLARRPSARPACAPWAVTITVRVLRVV